MYLVETEFLFGLRENDRWHKHVSEIIELHQNGKIEPLLCCSSAFLEAGVVLQSSGLVPEQVEEALFLMKQRMAEANIVELGLNSDDIVRLYELLRQFNITYFDAMQAAVALGRRATLISNDKTFKQIGIKTISFKELTKPLKE